MFLTKKKFKNNKEFKNWWENSKNKKISSIIDGIPSTYPAMLKAYKIQKKVASVGFEYKNDIEALDKIIEESNELKIEIKKKNKKKIKEELGDLIFSCLDLARKLNLNPEYILAKSNNKFSKRWKNMELQIKKDCKNLNLLNLNEFNYYWEKSKTN